MNDDKKLELCKTHATTIVALGKAISKADTLEECKTFVKHIQVMSSMLLEMPSKTTKDTCHWETCLTDVDPHTRGKMYCSKHAKKAFGCKRKRVDDEKVKDDDGDGDD